MQPSGELGDGTGTVSSGFGGATVTNKPVLSSTDDREGNDSNVDLDREDDKHGDGTRPDDDAVEGAGTRAEEQSTTSGDGGQKLSTTPLLSRHRQSSRTFAHTSGFDSSLVAQDIEDSSLTFGPGFFGSLVTALKAATQSAARFGVSHHEPQIIALLQSVNLRLQSGRPIFEPDVESSPETEVEKNNARERKADKERWLRLLKKYQEDKALSERARDKLGVLQSKIEVDEALNKNDVSSLKALAYAHANTEIEYHLNLTADVMFNGSERLNEIQPSWWNFLNIQHEMERKTQKFSSDFRNLFRSASGLYEHRFGVPASSTLNSCNNPQIEYQSGQIVLAGAKLRDFEYGLKLMFGSSVQGKITASVWKCPKPEDINFDMDQEVKVFFQNKHTKYFQITLLAQNYWVLVAPQGNTAAPPVNFIVRGPEGKIVSVAAKEACIQQWMGALSQQMMTTKPLSDEEEKAVQARQKKQPVAPMVLCKFNSSVSVNLTLEKALGDPEDEKTADRDNFGSAAGSRPRSTSLF